MSCGDPHETPCSEVLAAVYLYLDGEQDGEHHDVTRLHLDECSPCLREYGLDQMVKALVARTCGADTVPIDLRERVLLRIQQVRLEIDQVQYRSD